MKCSGIDLQSNNSVMTVTDEKAMKVNGVPEKVSMGISGANKTAINEVNARGENQIVIR